jgi:hypothetical protein
MTDRREQGNMRELLAKHIGITSSALDVIMTAIEEAIEAAVAEAVKAEREEKERLTFALNQMKDQFGAFMRGEGPLVSEEARGKEKA